MTTSAVAFFLLLLPLVRAGYLDQLPPLPQPNDVAGTVPGCANAILSHDYDHDGAIRRNEYLGFVNHVADLLCLPPRPQLDLELQSVFVGVACLCQELEGYEGVIRGNRTTCCFGQNAGLYLEGASSAAGRTQEQESYLRAACVWTQDVLGPEQCQLADATLSPNAGVSIKAYFPESPSSNHANNLLWLLLLLLLPLVGVLCCCCSRRNNSKEVEEEYEVTIEEQKVVVGPEHENEEEIPVGNDKDPYDPEWPGQDEESVEDAGQTAGVGRENAGEEEPPVMTHDKDKKESTEGIGEKASGSKVDKGDGDQEEPGLDGYDRDEESAEDTGQKSGISARDAEDEEGGRRFAGMGELPNNLPPEGIVLKHVVTQQEAPGGYDYMEREYHEFQYKREDSGQVLGCYEPDGGVSIPKRPLEKSVVLCKPSYKREDKPEPMAVDERKCRKQTGLGDGEVWEALAGWREEENKAAGNPETIDWVVQHTLGIFADAEVTGGLQMEASSSEELSTSS